MLTRRIPELAGEQYSALRAQLEPLISGRKLPHAIIIECEDQELGMRLARLLAQARLCTCPHPLSGECEVCRIVENGTHPDIVEVQGSGKTGAIPVDTIRQLHTYGSLVPELADGIVYLLRSGDLMLKPAQNAFLKLFEEPPANVTFIITCQTSAKLLETIRSRAYLLRMAVPDSTAAAESQLTEAAGELLLSLLSAKEADTLMLAARWSRSGKEGPNARRELTAVLGEMRSIARQALVIGSGAGEILHDPHPAAGELAKNLSPARIEQIMGELPDLEQSIRNNASLSLVTCALCVRLRKAAGK